MGSDNGNSLPEKFIIIGGLKIKYLDYDHEPKCSNDQHPVLVLLHGLGASCERWLNVAPMLSKYFRIIIPDIIGFGHSDKSSTEEYRMDYFV
ncbi:MAG TPA: alpha/beta fold hydrolase, partial [Nitrososphaeraceae archaeon]|nr:alpha/beta fold hydrolase [Nitrososphaeraceae archaeon]